jgi:hypothetical protein
LFDYAAVPLVSAVPVGLCFSPLFCHCNSSWEKVKASKGLYLQSYKLFIPITWCREHFKHPMHLLGPPNLTPSNKGFKTRIWVVCSHNSVIIRSKLGILNFKFNILDLNSNQILY